MNEVLQYIRHYILQLNFILSTKISKKSIRSKLLGSSKKTHDNDVIMTSDFLILLGKL